MVISSIMPSSLSDHSSPVNPLPEAAATRFTYFGSAPYSGVFTLLPLLTGEGRAHHGAILEQAARLAEAGKLVPLVDPRRFTLETVRDAYRAIEAQTARGKLVVEIANP
jgi:NADPH2:quinone reductase